MDDLGVYSHSRKPPCMIVNAEERDFLAYDTCGAGPSHAESPRAAGGSFANSFDNGVYFSPRPWKK